MWAVIHADTIVTETSDIGEAIIAAERERAKGRPCTVCDEEGHVGYDTEEARRLFGLPFIEA